MKDTLEKILKFRNDRDWAQFHKPKDLAMSLAIEAGELMECFQWKTDDQVKEMISSPDRSKIIEEIADVGSYLLLLCDELDVDLFEAIEGKIQINASKYPIDKARGSSKKYTDL